MRRFAALLGIGLLLLSCGPVKRAQWHINRAYALNPNLGDSAVVAILDTVIVPGDTIDREIVTTERDTIEIYKDRVRTRIIRSFDTLQVYTECPADTIVREVKVKCPPQVVAGPMGLKWWIWLIIGFGISLLLFLFITSRR